MGGKRRGRARRHRLFWRTAAAILALLTLAVTVPAVARLASQAQNARADLETQAVARPHLTAPSLYSLPPPHYPQPPGPPGPTILTPEPRLEPLLDPDPSGP